jgi:hypothetical protein
MVKQFVYVDTASAAGDLVRTEGGTTIILDINGLLQNLPPYVNVKLLQLEYITTDVLNDGLILKIGCDASNQLNLNKKDSVVGICTFSNEDVVGGVTTYHFENRDRTGFPVTISGNIQQLRFYFVNTNNVSIPLANVLFAAVFELETPDVGSVVGEYRKAIPL